MREFKYRGQETRCFLPFDFKVTTFEALEPFLQELEERNFGNKDELERWLWEWSEVQAVLSEEAGWRYIKMTCNTADKELQEKYSDFVQNIQPKVSEYFDRLNRKFIDCPVTKKLRVDVYGTMIRDVESAIALFRTENIALKSELAELSRKFGSITGGLMVDWKGEEKTLQAMSLVLKSEDREERKSAFEKVAEQRAGVRTDLHELLDELIAKRNLVAKNAGFDNFRDYQFKSLGRFDYGVKECEDFHAAIASSFSPLFGEDLKHRKAALGFDLKPYDLSVPLPGQNNLVPFSDEQDLIQKNKAVFHKIHPYFGGAMDTMEEIGHLDLSSRKGKSPGGYNYPLYVSNAPFIFMNAVGSHSDMITMTHEGGHAVHSFLTADLKYTSQKGLSSEVAELASMSTELISMDFWDTYYEGADLNQAKADQMERVVSIFPWVACVDAFQHWLYTCPDHSHAERNAKWVELYKQYHPDVVNWEGYEDELAHMWQKQLHIFEVPFYYIEYAIAQLGAVAVWKNVQKKQEKGLEQFMSALAVGAMRDIPYVYERAGIGFDFSEKYVQEMADFVQLQKKQFQN